MFLWLKTHGTPLPSLALAVFIGSVAGSSLAEVEHTLAWRDASQGRKPTRSHACTLWLKRSIMSVGFSGYVSFRAPPPTPSSHSPFRSHPIHLMSILPRLRAPPPCPALPRAAPSCPVLSSAAALPTKGLAPSCSCSPLNRCRRPLHPRFRSSSSPPLQQPSPSSFLFLLLLYPQPQHPAQVRQTDRSAWGAPRRQKE